MFDTNLETYAAVKLLIFFFRRIYYRMKLNRLVIFLVCGTPLRYEILHVGNQIIDLYIKVSCVVNILCRRRLAV